MKKTKAIVLFLFGATAITVSLSGCSHEGALRKQRAECQKIASEGDRARCLQKAADEERAYERKRNETRIEESYKRKLDDMRPRPTS